MSRETMTWDELIQLLQETQKVVVDHKINVFFEDATESAFGLRQPNTDIWGDAPYCVVLREGNEEVQVRGDEAYVECSGARMPIRFPKPISTEE